MDIFAFRHALMVLAFIGLSACTNASVDQTLAPKPIASNAQDLPQSASAEPLKSASQSSSVIGYATDDLSSPSESANQVAALNLNNSVTFLPIEGAPQSAATVLSNSIKTRAEVHGLSVLPSSKSGAKYRVKGYFSALSDGTGTLLVYIWDVLDASGKRVHRINGRERSGGTSINPWQSVSDSELLAMADTTTSKLKSWVDSRN